MIGLVLNGGGGKGAYQIGVWKYLREVGLTFDYVSGTSAGALNASLICQNEFEKANQIWCDLTTSKVVRLDPVSVAKMLASILTEMLKFLLLKRNAKNSRLIREIVRNCAIFVECRNVLSLFLENGIVSTQPLISLLDNNIDYENFPKKPEMFITTIRDHPIFLFEDLKYINFTDCHPLVKRKLLIATSAIPFLFPSSNIGNIHYSDGGIPRVGDNSPIYPLYEKGCKSFFVIHLKPDGKTDKETYPNCKIIDIAPSENLGSTLSLNSKHHIELGYNDAKNKLNNLSVNFNN